MFNDDAHSEKSYSPFFNTIGSVIVFRFDIKQSFMNVINWYEESNRYSNLKKMYFFIIGYLPPDRPSVINEEEVNTLVEHISITDTVKYFMYNGTNTSELRTQFFDFVDEVYSNEFNATFMFASSTRLSNL